MPSPVRAHHISGSNCKKVEGVENCLVLDSRLIPLFSEPAKIHIDLWSCDEVQDLSSLSLIATLQEELNQAQDIGLLPALGLQQFVDACFQKHASFMTPRPVLHF